MNPQPPSAFSTLIKPEEYEKLLHRKDELQGIKDKWIESIAQHINEGKVDGKFQLKQKLTFDEIMRMRSQIASLYATHGYIIHFIDKDDVTCGAYNIGVKKNYQ